MKSFQENITATGKSTLKKKGKYKQSTHVLTVRSSVDRVRKLGNLDSESVLNFLHFDLILHLKKETEIERRLLQIRLEKHKIRQISS